jgi:hypothetical protein
MIRLEWRAVWLETITYGSEGGGDRKKSRPTLQVVGRLLEKNPFGVNR